MPSLFDPADNATILTRLEKLQPGAQRQWGKMEVDQMLKHCQQPLRVVTGDLPLKRGLLGMLFGKMALRQLLDPKPWKQGMMTAPAFKVVDRQVFAQEKQRLAVLVKRFAAEGPTVIANRDHPFFGPMTVEEWDQLQWRHLDHHFRQFGA